MDKFNECERTYLHSILENTEKSEKRIKEFVRADLNRQEEAFQGRMLKRVKSTGRLWDYLYVLPWVTPQSFSNHSQQIINASKVIVDQQILRRILSPCSQVLSSRTSTISSYSARFFLSAYTFSLRVNRSISSYCKIADFFSPLTRLTSLAYFPNVANLHFSSVLVSFKRDTKVVWFSFFAFLSSPIA